jgi:hypothetical protein
VRFRSVVPQRPTRCTPEEALARMGFKLDSHISGGLFNFCRLYVRSRKSSSGEMNTFCDGYIDVSLHVTDEEDVYHIITLIWYYSDITSCTVYLILREYVRLNYQIVSCILRCSYASADNYMRVSTRIPLGVVEKKEAMTWHRHLDSNHHQRHDHHDPETEGVEYPGIRNQRSWCHLLQRSYLQD